MILSRLRLRAHALFMRPRYIMRNNEVIIVDEFGHA